MDEPKLCSKAGINFVWKKGPTCKETKYLEYDRNTILYFTA